MQGKYRKEQMAQFKKGQSINPKGKAIGTKNKTSERLRLTISNFLELEFPTIRRDFKKLSPRDRAKLFVDLMPFAVAKLQAVSIDMDFNKMSEQQLDDIINELTKKAHEQQQTKED